MPKYEVPLRVSVTAIVDAKGLRDAHQIVRDMLCGRSGRGFFVDGNLPTTLRVEPGVRICGPLGVNTVRRCEGT